ncbi:MAG: carbohydrate kinase [Actinobacteria bacterium]|nr:carbohydrate kinase [Actinomycetota bacterium]
MVTVIGEALVDLVDAGDHQTYVAHCGGSPLNVAVGLARLGQPTSLMARFGPDAFGRRLRDYAETNYVDLSAAVAASEPTTLAVVSLDEQARATYDFWIEGTADWQWSDDELERLPPATTLVHTGSLAAWTAPGAQRIAALLARLHTANRVTISYDPNVRARLLGSPTRARALVEDSVRLCHVAKASDEDVAWLYPDRSPAEVAAGWLELGATLVVVTAGPDGATGFVPGLAPVMRPGRRIELRDTVGAGDAFTAGLLDALVRNELTDPATHARLGDPKLLASLLDDAILVAALTCERPGADPPTAAAVAAARRR